MRTWFAASIVLCLCACAASARVPQAHEPVATISARDLASAVAHHPLAPLLKQYDEELAALRAPQALGAINDTPIAAVRVPTNLAQNHPAESYRQALADQERAQLSDYAAALARRVDEGVALRAAQLREKEATLDFDLARADAPKRLTLRLRLQNLYLDHHQRALLQAQLAAMNAREEGPVAALRQADAAELASYRAQLQAQNARDYAAMASQLHASQRSDVATGQAIDRAPSARSVREAQQGFDRARSDLTARFKELRSADASARAAAITEIRALQDEREALYQAIVAQILRSPRDSTLLSR